ncbi:protein FAM169B isoform X3 [Oryctolagus cuniculus]|uniref:protein FAM169B isoform X3 n=1 Tax=Oryctolagus cuniculus TaxID=9986 RepID=UPI0038796EB4
MVIRDVEESCTNTSNGLREVVQPTPAGIYPVDVLEDDPDGHREATLTYYASLREGARTPPAALRFPTGEQVKLEASSVCLCTVYRDDPQHKLLVLVNPQDTKTVVAVYVKESWWCTEDVLRTSDPAREGLMEVQAFGERIVLFILNVVIFGRSERSLDDDAMFFLPHSAKERAKILWRNGAAVGFYTTKRKGSLCGDGTGACYLLPVLDTVFVRRKHRRQGLGTAMLRDFCETFSEDEALGVSCPISPAMYQVCRQFLLAYPEERGRLWEVEPPGAWGQRTSIWLKVQLQQARLGEWPPAGLYLAQELLGFILQPLVSQCWQVLQMHSKSICIFLEKEFVGNCLLPSVANGTHETGPPGPDFHAV